MKHKIKVTGFKTFLGVAQAFSGHIFKAVNPESLDLIKSPTLSFIHKPLKEMLTNLCEHEADLDFLDIAGLISHEHPLETDRKSFNNISL